MNKVKDKLNVFAKMLILALVFVSFSACKNTKKVEIKNKDGIIIESYYVNKKNPLQKVGAYSKFYDNGKMVESATYKNGKLDGVRILYHPNGNKMQEENYVNDKLEGKVISFYEDGSLQQEAVYKDNMGNGVWKNYYKEHRNVIKEEITVVENRINGAFTEYYPNGKIFAKGNKIEINEGLDAFDTYDGKVEVYDSIGNLDKILIFEKGKQISKEEK